MVPDRVSTPVPSLVRAPVPPMLPLTAIETPVSPDMVPPPVPRVKALARVELL